MARIRRFEINAEWEYNFVTLDPVDCKRLICDIFTFFETGDEPDYHDCPALQSQWDDMRTELAHEYDKKWFHYFVLDQYLNVDKVARKILEKKKWGYPTCKYLATKFIKWNKCHANDGWTLEKWNKTLNVFMQKELTEPDYDEWLELEAYSKKISLNKRVGTTNHSVMQN